MRISTSNIITVLSLASTALAATLPKVDFKYEGKISDACRKDLNEYFEKYRECYFETPGTEVRSLAETCNDMKLKKCEEMFLAMDENLFCSTESLDFLEVFTAFRHINHLYMLNSCKTDKNKDFSPLVKFEIEDRKKIGNADELKKARNEAIKKTCQSEIFSYDMSVFFKNLHRDSYSNLNENDYFNENPEAAYNFYVNCNKNPNLTIDDNINLNRYMINNTTKPIRNNTDNGKIIGNESTYASDAISTNSSRIVLISAFLLLFTLI